MTLKKIRLAGLALVTMTSLSGCLTSYIIGNIAEQASNKYNHIFHYKEVYKLLTDKVNQNTATGEDYLGLAHFYLDKHVLKEIGKDTNNSYQLYRSYLAKAVSLGNEEAIIEAKQLELIERLPPMPRDDNTQKLNNPIALANKIKEYQSLAKNQTDLFCKIFPVQLTLNIGNTNLSLNKLNVIQSYRYSLEDYFKSASNDTYHVLNDENMKNLQTLFLQEDMRCNSFLDNQDEMLRYNEKTMNGLTYYQALLKLRPNPEVATKLFSRTNAQQMAEIERKSAQLLATYKAVERH